MDLDWYFRTEEEKRSSLPVVIFDGDDTLWATEALYDSARSRAASVVAKNGLSASRFEELQRVIDVENFTQYGFSQRRFPISSQQAYEALAREVGQEIDGAVSEEVYAAAARVFLSPAPVDREAETTLASLQTSHRLLLLTKGDTWVQKRRIDDSNLMMLLDGACIVEEKDETVFEAVLREVGADSSVSWSVGNSYGADVLPAVTTGMKAVWIDTPVWGLEQSRSRAANRREHPNIFVANRLGEVPTIVAQESAQDVEP